MLPKELCLELFTVGQHDHICLKAKDGHTYHECTNAGDGFLPFRWYADKDNSVKADTGNKALRDEISQLLEENARLEKENRELQETKTNWQRTATETQESKERWISRYYRSNEKRTALEAENRELKTKITNQAKSLTQMHKANVTAKRRKAKYNEAIRALKEIKVDAVFTSLRKENRELHRQVEELQATKAKFSAGYGKPLSEYIEQNNRQYKDLQDAKARIDHLNREVTALHKTNMEQATKIRNLIDPNAIKFIVLRTENGMHSFRVQ